MTTNCFHLHPLLWEAAMSHEQEDTNELSHCTQTHKGIKKEQIREKKIKNVTSWWQKWSLFTLTGAPAVCPPSFSTHAAVKRHLSLWPRWGADKSTLLSRPAVKISSFPMAEPSLTRVNDRVGPRSAARHTGALRSHNPAIKPLLQKWEGAVLKEEDNTKRK